jgi:hypothetical protein
VRYLSPNVLYEPSPVVSAGKLEHYPENSVTLDPRLALFVSLWCAQTKDFMP